MSRELRCRDVEKAGHDVAKSSRGAFGEKRRSNTRGVGFPAFDRCVGIGYSGAKTRTSILDGLRVYVADCRDAR